MESTLPSWRLSSLAPARTHWTLWGFLLDVCRHLYSSSDSLDCREVSWSELGFYWHSMSIVVVLFTSVNFGLLWHTLLTKYVAIKIHPNQWGPQSGLSSWCTFFQKKTSIPPWGIDVRHDSFSSRGERIEPLHFFNRPLSYDQRDNLHFPLSIYR